MPSRQDFVDTWKYTQPDHAPERITTFDALRFVNTNDEGFALIDGGSTAYEIARVDVQHGLLVLESIDTWARLRQVNPGGPTGQADELLSWDPGNSTNMIPDLRGLGSPFPFPVMHDNNAGSPIEIEWVLVLDRSDENSQPARLLGPAPLDLVPTQMGTPAYWPSVWSDQRYAWKLNYTPQKWTATGPAVLRLFAKIKTQPLEGGTDPAWEIQVAGRLRGYQQPAGPSGAAFRNVTIRTRRQKKTAATLTTAAAMALSS